MEEKMLDNLYEVWLGHFLCPTYQVLELDIQYFQNDGFCLMRLRVREKFADLFLLTYTYIYINQEF